MVTENLSTWAMHTTISHTYVCYASVVAVSVAAIAKNGHVTLTGAVRCGTERAAAEALIADLTGVRTVTDDIQIRDNADPLYPGTEPMERP